MNKLISIIAVVIWVGAIAFILKGLIYDPYMLDKKDVIGKCFVSYSDDPYDKSDYKIYVKEEKYGSDGKLYIGYTYKPNGTIYGKRKSYLKYYEECE